MKQLRLVFWEAVMGKLDMLTPYLSSEILACIKPYENMLTEIRIKKDSFLCITLLSKEGGAFGFGDNKCLDLLITKELFDRTLDRLCNHSLYSHMETMVDGYLTVAEGFRVGVAGKAVCEQGKIRHLSSISSLNIRIPRHISGCGSEIYEHLKKSHFQKSILLYSPPNMGKTTILRDIAASLVRGNDVRRVVIVDTRCEIETEELRGLSHLDILSSYPRGKGIEIATRTLSPQYILCDEIGGYEEVLSLLSVQNCGVPVIATAHAATVSELLSRENIALLHENRMFSEYVGIRRMRQGLSPILSFTQAQEISLSGRRVRALGTLSS